MSDHWPSIGRGRGKRAPRNELNGAAGGGSCGGGVWNTKNVRQQDVGSFVTKETSTAKFEEACEKIRQSSQKFLRNDKSQLSKEENTDSSDDEDERPKEEVEKREKILNDTLGRYAELSDERDLDRTHTYLLESSKSGSCVCLICISSIKKTEAIWSCSGCFCVFHLPCIQTWAKDSLNQRLLQTQSEDEIVSTSLRWCCPKCRFEYDRRECPTKYVCFCGKEFDPVFDPWLLPHSCGQTCGRDLKPICGHKCLLLCHPGPCPPCPKLVKVPCYCGKQSPETRRCSNKNWSCGKPCGRKLSCNQHVCKNPCHKGDCEPCTKQSIQPCFCTKEKRNRPCAESGWQCSTVCDRPLSCGYHNCSEVCHKGPCGDCPRSKNRTCPCGKTAYELPCTQDIPSCGDTCSKMLPCGIHECAQRCHLGVCGTCYQMNTKRCRCGRTKKALPCHKEYSCDNKCKKMRNCGRHPCNRKCCDGNCPSCGQNCNRGLSCRNHKCSNNCHQGPCYPCPRTVEVKCRCGRTSISVPCGREKVTKPPKCSKNCTIAPDCHHSSREPHMCHFDKCPPCKQKCEKKLTCSHICTAKCHSYVPITIGKKQVRAGPWEPEVAPRVEFVCQPCPSCRVPVPVTCLGKHETRDFPCFESTPKSCGRPCGRQLCCTNHKCLLECHLCPDSSKANSDNCVQCEEPCSLPRPDGCSHFCNLPCHPRPCPPCKQNLRLRCHCQLYTVYVLCSKFTNTAAEERSKLLTCNNRCPKQMPCQHRCTLMCHDGVCSSPEECSQKVSVRCACKRIKQFFFCSDVQKGRQDLVSCNSICKEKIENDRKAKEAEVLKKKLVEEKKNEKELKNFQRMMEGKRRKPRKEKEVIETISFWAKYKVMLSVSLCVAIVAVFAYILFAA